MKTEEALTRFLKKCEERGLAPETRRVYHGYLRHFAQEHPTLPTDTKIIEQFLSKRKETPSKRGSWFKKLQAFYSYLEQYEGITSPVPGKAKIGRPRKEKAVTSISTLTENKLVKGGYSLSDYTSISTLEAVEALIKAKKVEGVTERSLANYPIYFKPFIRKYPTLPVTVEPIEEFLGSIKGEPETRASYRKHLISLYHFLERRKRIPKDLFEFPKMKVPRKVRRVLSEDEMRQLFSFTEDFQEKVILATFIDTKVRVSELISMTREKLYPDHITVQGKTGERDVPLNSETYDMLCLLAPKGQLFRQKNGKPMQRVYLRLKLRRLMERSGLEGERLGPQILRHSASVQHMMHGGDLLSLKEELGHTTTKMTEIYGRLAFPEVKQRHKEVNVLGNITNGSAPSSLERASCYVCKKEIVLELAKVQEVECPNCHQVGKWYLPNHRGQMVLA